MILQINIILAILSAVTSVVTFVMYVRARMAEKDRQEKICRSIHFISLFLFTLLGVLILIQLADKLQPPVIE